MRTRHDAELEVIEAIESGGAASREEYDIDKIVDELYPTSEYLCTADHDQFWAAVMKHEKPSGKRGERMERNLTEVLEDLRGLRMSITEPRYTISNHIGASITSRVGYEIADAVSAWFPYPTVRETELIESLHRAIDLELTYLAGIICDALGLTYAYSY